MANYGMKVSLPGYDVFSATPEQCAVHSGYASPLIDAEPGVELDTSNPKHFGSATVIFNSNPPSGAETTLFTVTHNLGYIPFSMVNASYYQFPSGFDFRGTFPLYITGATLNFYAECTATTFTVKVYYDSGYGSLVGERITFFYQLFSSNGA